MKMYRFRLSTADGAVYYCDSVNSVLRVVDNTRAHRGGVIFSRCEYGEISRGKVRRWFPVRVDDLRNHDFAVIAAADEKSSGCRWLAFYMIGAFAAGVLALGWYLMR